MHAWEWAVSPQYQEPFADFAIRLGVNYVVLRHDALSGSVSTGLGVFCERHEKTIGSSFRVLV